MSDIGVPLHRIWCCSGHVKLVSRLSLTATILQLMLLVESTPTTSDGGLSRDDGGVGGGSVIESIDVKYYLLAVVLLLVIIVVTVVVVVCLRCWRHKACTKSESVPQPMHHPTSACAGCMRSDGLSSHVRMSESNRCGIDTIYDPRRCCMCSVHCHHLHHGDWPMNVHARSTSPPGYPVGTPFRVPGLNPALDRAEPSRAGQEISLAVDQSDDRGQNTETRRPASPVEIPEREAVSPVRFHVRNNYIPENDNQQQTTLMRSLASSQASNQISPGVFNPTPDDNINLGSLHSLADSQKTYNSAPLNIECPGIFETFPDSLRDLFVPRPRSERRTVAGKLVVSVARLVDAKGDFLVLDDMGISLQIPPGAVLAGQRQMVSLVLNWDLGDNPEMDNTQSLVSPVVYCGPHGLQLDKPCVLSFKHCAFDPRMVQVLSSQTELIEQKKWQVMCSADDSAGAVAMTTDECQVRLQHFSLFTCVQTPLPGSTGKKWLQVAAFCAPLQRQVHHYQVRVYFLNKTPCALQWAIQNEARFGFRLACPERTFLFHGSGEDLHLTVSYVSRGWVAVREDEAAEGSDVCETVSYHAVWHGKCPHLAFCFKRTCLLPDRPQPAPSPSGVTSPMSFPAKVQAHVSEINLDLAVFQDSSSNCPDRINLLLTEVPPHQQHEAPSPSRSPDDSIPGCTPTHLLPACNKHPICISMPPVQVSSGKITGKVRIDQEASGPNVLVDFEQDPDCMSWPSFVEGVDPERGGEGLKGEVFPRELKLKLKLKLDPHCTFGKDWTLLASKLGLDKYIRWLMSNDDPTLRVLEYMEMKNMDLQYLCFLLKSMDRYDAAADVEDVIRKRKGLMSPLNEGQEHSHSPDDLQDDLNPLQKTTSWMCKGEEESSDAHDVISKRHLVTQRLDEGQEHSDVS